MMFALFRKDLRLLRPLLTGYAALAAVIYGVVFVLVIWDVVDGTARGPSKSNFELFQILTVCNAVIGVALLPLFAAVGGMAFAAERRDRWGELSSMLPVSRGRQVLVKLGVSLGVCVGLAAANVLAFHVALWLLRAMRFSLRRVLDVMAVQMGPYGMLGFAMAAGVGLLVWVGLRRQSLRRRLVVMGAVLAAFLILDALVIGLDFQTRLMPDHDGRFAHADVQTWWSMETVIRSALPGFQTDRVLKWYAPVAVSLFGVAWLLSACLRSPVLATVYAIGAVGGAYLSGFDIYSLGKTQQPDMRAATNAMLALLTAAALACVAAGAMVQLRRGTP